MAVYRVEQTNQQLIERILAIHDEMPRDWDSTHATTEEHRGQLYKKIIESTDLHGFWILSDELPSQTTKIDGLIWLKVANNPATDQRTCYINSFWVRPELRRNKRTLPLTQVAVSWAKEQGATLLECTTHSQNSRMREILEQLGFVPGMLQYTRAIHSIAPDKTH